MENFEIFIDQSEACWELCQTSKIEVFVKIVNGWQPLFFLANNYTSDVPRCSEYAPEYGMDVLSSYVAARQED